MQIKIILILKRIIELLKLKPQNAITLFYLLYLNKYDYKKCNYDEILSLGYNCEISYRLLFFFSGYLNHFLFSWSNINSRNALILALQNLDNFSESEYTVLPWGMLKNEKYDINFHSRYKNRLIDKNGDYTKNVPLAIKELKSRLKHLAEKTNNIIRSNKNILFIIKLEYTNFNEDINFIKELNTILNEMHKNNNYKLLVVLSKNNYPKELIQKFINNCPENVSCETVSEFADIQKSKLSGDIYGWYKILKKTCKTS